MPESLPPPILVHEESSLRELLADMEGQERIALDTESDSFFSYKEKVCLLQVTVGDRDYLVDPLSGIDLAPMGPILSDPNSIKIFHDGEYDVTLLRRDFGFELRGLFDTRVAAAVLGQESPGLASVLEHEFDVRLDKSMQRSNWGKRPLSDEQISYARLDTRYLIELMDKQVAALDESGRRMVVDTECRRLELLDVPASSFQPDEFARIKGALKLEPLSRQVLRELFVWRDSVSRERDVPPFRVLTNQALMALSEAAPSSRGDLERIPGFSPKLASRYGGPILEATRRARRRGPMERLPKLPPKRGVGFDEVQTELHDRLRRWRKRAAIKAGFDAAYLVNRHVLIEIVRSEPTTAEGLVEAGLVDWQEERYGDDVLKVIATFKDDVKSGAWEPRQPKSRGRRS